MLIFISCNVQKTFTVLKLITIGHDELQLTTRHHQIDTGFLLIVDQIRAIVFEDTAIVMLH